MVSFLWLGMMLNLLPHLMPGLMVVWCWTMSLGSVWLGVESTLTLLVLLCLVGSGVIWIYSLLCLIVGVRPAGFIAAPCRLYSGLRFGVFQLLCKVVPGCMSGVDNLNVVSHVLSIIAGKRFARPFPLVKDGDLLFRIQRMVRWRGPHNVCF